MYVHLNLFFALSYSPLIVSFLVTLSYFLFYTAYDKTAKKLLSKNLIDLIFLQRGIDWTLVEINKAISLSGLTTLLMSFCPLFSQIKYSLLFISMNLLWVHSVYSMYKFYGYELKRLLADKVIKKISILLGIAGQLAVASGYYGFITYHQLVLSGVLLSIAHFWTMEVDYKYKLQVRPYAYLPFPLAVLVLYYLFAK